VQHVGHRHRLTRRADRPQRGASRPSDVPIFAAHAGRPIAEQRNGPSGGWPTAVVGCHCRVWSAVD
jgi:hypothetical protein